VLVVFPNARASCVSLCWLWKAALVPQDSVLFLSTLDGSLIAVSKNTGKIVWSLKEGL